MLYVNTGDLYCVLSCANVVYIFITEVIPTALGLLQVIQGGFLIQRQNYISHEGAHETTANISVKYNILYVL